MSAEKNLDYKIIGINISECRRKKGITQENLSEMLGITPQYLSLIENGHRHINLKLLVRISEALDISIDRLLFGNRSGDNEAYDDEFAKLIADCNEYEKAVILKSAENLKIVMGKYSNLK